MITDCPCGSNTAYEQCCGPFLEGTQSPITPEQLMRSRYTAFTQTNVDYLIKTMRGPASENFQPDFTRKWAGQVEWLGLDVLQAPPVAEGADIGWVEFMASYKEEGKIHQIHEVSEFHRIKGYWYYVRGKHQGERKPYVKSR